MTQNSKVLGINRPQIIKGTKPYFFDKPKDFYVKNPMFNNTESNLMHVFNLVRGLRV